MNILMKIYEKIMFLINPIEYSRKIGVNIGHNCRFLSVNKGTFGTEPYLIHIGNHVTVTSGVKFITHDGGVWVFREKNPNIDVFGQIEIGDNVFIGLNSIILPGTVINNNVVIGAGSVVKGLLESDSVYAGVPAKYIMSIDEYEKKILQKADFIRSKDYVEKKNYLNRKFNNEK